MFQAGDKIECQAGRMSGERWTMHRIIRRFAVLLVPQLKVFVIRDREILVVFIYGGPFIVFQLKLATDEAKLNKDSARVEVEPIGIGGDFLVKQVVHSIP
jgi:hypothetical protein